MKIPLKFPVKLATGQTLTELDLRRGKRKEMALAAKYSEDPGEQEDFLLGMLTGLTVEDIGELDLADSKRLMDAFRLMVEGRDTAEDAGSQRSAAERGNADAGLGAATAG
ncbi:MULTISPECIES: phage tail assembly protein [Burkholderia cepacia complex]|uniref:phage tail assembly protein n=1 Tax=Burkholderia cepacia complex TaxID=87882 RepID=UPI001CF18BCD|nr:phage tail assembly protein [Burkholderia vietnamiensis]MCA8194478.1 phage tail assembly protein [Burkholderia vietnamiensis]HDR8991496.1 phage tail assembly protein [Burkholderia vietnamiensis]HDV6364362.1 phage tail assembly protein [Burkholderia cepacia]